MDDQDLRRLDLRCPGCGESLTRGDRVLLAAYSPELGRDGEVLLSAVFGRYEAESDLDVPADAVVEFRCPSCAQNLMVATRCRLCGAAMASLNLADGGYVEFCARRGCKAHAVGGAGDVDQMIGLVNRMTKTPHD